MLGTMMAPGSLAMPIAADGRFRPALSSSRSGESPTESGMSRIMLSMSMMLGLRGLRILSRHRICPRVSFFAGDPPPPAPPPAAAPPNAPPPAAAAATPNASPAQSCSDVSGSCACPDSSSACETDAACPISTG